MTLARVTIILCLQNFTRPEISRTQIFIEYYKNYHTFNIANLHKHTRIEIFTNKYYRDANSILLLQMYR